MSDDLNLEDLHWLELVAGHDVPDARSSCRQEASWLRAAMLTYRLDEPRGEPTDPAIRIERLLARAVRAGLIDEPARQPVRQVRISIWNRLQRSMSWRWRDLAVGLATVGAVALVAMNLFTQGPGTADGDTAGQPEVSRGAAVQSIRSQAPLELQRRLLAECERAGLRATPFKRLDRLGLEIELPASPSEEQRALLARQGLQLPAGSLLVVEILDSADMRPER